MKTKSKPGSTTLASYGEWFLDTFSNSYTAYRTIGDSVITYDDGPKYVGHHLKWKECHQKTNNYWSADGSWTLSALLYGWYKIGVRNFTSDAGFSSNSPLPVANPDLTTCFGKILDQIDLNCEDSVLLYSGILQAVPLVGGAFKFVSVMNQAARKLTKSFKHKPFTTVVKTLIQGDFINRFVVKPTMDDAMKFLDASNYVLRVLNTAYERNAMPVRYEGQASDVITSSENGRIPFPLSGGGFRNPYLHYTQKSRVGTTSNMFMLAEVSYNTDAISPIKLWAARCGLTKPLDSVWDLVPFSFVIDYFSRAGDFIAGLSNEMSSQDGLRGCIQRIHGCWATIKTENTVERTYTRSEIYNPDGPCTSTGLPFRVKWGSTQFDRIPVNPWYYLPSEPSGFLKWDMSSTRYRTLLELWIQSKL